MSLQEPRSILETHLSMIKQNVLEGIKSAQTAGLEVQLPTQIKLEIPLNLYGLPIQRGEQVAARLETVLYL